LREIYVFSSDTKIDDIAHEVPVCDHYQ
jgi:hypothetical protein